MVLGGHRSVWVGGWVGGLGGMGMGGLVSSIGERPPRQHRWWGRGEGRFGWVRRVRLLRCWGALVAGVEESGILSLAKD
ncbi:hypothetical protein TIFTF001_054302 [Ficus carica]|uniref:Uncharacterized protein n=1 Tax=Ficus carica TaxID=3494 RepID=A0AA88EF17_FICCA|nr:hypothetical protein TIFTF001_054302 [Ficus carica]